MSTEMDEVFNIGSSLNEEGLSLVAGSRKQESSEGTP